MKQIRTGNVSRLSANREEIVLLRELRNGLWTCRGYFTPVPIGIYGRNTGKLLLATITIIPCRYLRLSLLFKPGVGHDQAGLESSPCAWSG